MFLGRCNSNDLLQTSPIRLRTWSLPNRAEQFRKQRLLASGIARESLEFKLNCVGVVSTPLATPRIETLAVSLR
jgi:hypothetical protein